MNTKNHQTQHQLPIHQSIINVHGNALNAVNVHGNEDHANLEIDHGYN